MSDRLFIGAVGHAQRTTWGVAVARPQIFPDPEGFTVISPRTDRSRFLELCITDTGGSLCLLPLGRAGKDYEDHFAGQDTVVLAPIGNGSPISASGFTLANSQHQALRHYIPLDGSKTDKRVWPDWRFELAIRGLALFLGVPAGGDARPGPDVILGKAVAKRPSGGLVAWLNPLVVGFAGDLAVPGLKGGAQVHVHFTTAIRAAIDAGQWMLVPSLSTAARRRLLGWQTYCAGLTTSLLGRLFNGDPHGVRGEQLNPLRLADLAALDELDGVFHVGADRRAVWQWAAPAGPVDPALAQLRAVLLEALGLEAAPETAPGRYVWSRGLPGPRRRLFELPGLAGSSVEARLAAAATRIATGRRVRAALLGFADLGKRVETGMPSDATDLLDPLLSGVFHERGGEVSVDVNAELQVIATDFLAPRSPMVASLGRPVVADEHTDAFATKWVATSIDLFTSPGNAAVEALLNIVDPGTVSAESRYDGNWWSVYWRYCVVGDDTSLFRLRPDDGGWFTLDESELDGSDVLSGAAI